MQSENPLIADFVKLMNSAAGTFAGMTREARESGRERFKEAFGGLDFVSREEFEAVKAMAAKAREEADALRARLDAIDAMMAGGYEALEQRLARIAALEERMAALDGAAASPAPAPAPASAKPKTKRAK